MKQVAFALARGIVSSHIPITILCTGMLHLITYDSVSLFIVSSESLFVILL